MNQQSRRPSGHGGDRAKTEGFNKRRMFARKKVCRFCRDRLLWLDYKNINLVKEFVTDRGKIVPATVTGTCATHQRQLTTAVKRLRHLALLPFTTVHYKPFDMRPPLPPRQ